VASPVSRGVRKVAPARAEVGDIRPAVTAGNVYKVLGQVSPCWTGLDSGSHFPESNRAYDPVPLLNSQADLHLSLNSVSRHAQTTAEFNSGIMRRRRPA